MDIITEEKKEKKIQINTKIALVGINKEKNLFYIKFKEPVCILYPNDPLLRNSNIKITKPTLIYTMTYKLTEALEKYYEGYIKKLKND